MDAMDAVPALAEALRRAWAEGRTVYLCGNGGSAGNAIHLANDLLYGGRGAARRRPQGGGAERQPGGPHLPRQRHRLRQHLRRAAARAKAVPGDVLIVLSGSGNSPNVIKALEVGAQRGMATFAILGFSGGRCKNPRPASDPLRHRRYADRRGPAQLVVSHICMQWLCANPPTSLQG